MKITRRQAAGLLMTAASARRVYGANDRVGLALIGSGRRGREVMGAFLADERSELRCICDVYDVQRDRAKTALVKGGAAPQELVAHEEALALRGVDAVLIATPDHLHLPLAQAALAAGKHVYLEKPTVHRWSERIPLEQAAAKAKVVLQCGTQQRSGAHYRRAKEEIFGAKKLGQVLMARAVWHNFPWQQRHIKPSPQPAGLDWKRFLGPAPAIPYEAARYDSWRYFPDYGGGLLADILTHWVDVAQWMQDDARPQSAVALGGIYGEKDGRQNPDTVNAILQYKGWNLSFESSVLPIRNDRPGVLFEGTEGLLELARDGYTFTPRQGSPVSVASEGSLERAHTKNFLDAVRNGQPVSAPLAAGLDASRPVQMALKSYWERKTITAEQFG